jgi:hypothetical protein
VREVAGRARRARAAFQAKELQARQWRATPLPIVPGAFEHGDDAILRQVPELPEAVVERRVAERRLAHGLHQPAETLRTGRDRRQQLGQSSDRRDSVDGLLLERLAHELG